MRELYEPDAKKKLIATAVCIAVIAIMVILTDQLKTKPQTAAVSQATDTAQANPAPTTTAASSGTYKDGTYTAAASYYVPRGSEDIQVSLTIKNGVVTSSDVQNSENDQDSARYQEDFSAVYQSQVVGKSISGLKLSIVSGASDTTDGFNAAVSKIAAQAQA